MKTLILIAAIFLVCGAVNVEVKPSSHEVKVVNSTNNNAQESQPPKTGQKEDQAGGSSVKIGNSANSMNESTPPKSKMPVEDPSGHQDVSDLLGENVFSRAAYLLTGISVLVLLYFAWKSFSLRRRQTHIHKYGVVASREDLEMTSLGFGSEDEDDDTTHFDIGKHQRS